MRISATVGKMRDYFILRHPVDENYDARHCVVTLALVLVCPSEFYASELTDHSFNRAVLRLNHNILRLCFTQGGINVVGINPRHSIVNLLMVLSSPDLGCVSHLYIICYSSSCQ